MSTKVFIVSHKNLKLPRLNGYYPLQVGLSKHDFIGYLRDNTGENIAEKNPNYCELTAMYWIWKNVHSDIKGLVHYRRFFSNSPFLFTLKQKHSHIIGINDINLYLSNYDMILPRKRHYYIETNWSHYVHAHNSEGIKETKRVIAKYYPNYLKPFKISMNSRSAHMFNMMIAKLSVFDAYSKWLFSVLYKVEHNLDISNWDTYESRVYGFISELLLDVWLRKHSNITYKELPVAFMGNQHWIKKSSNFIMRKVCH